MKKEERDLIKSAQDGNQEALEQVLVNYKNLVVSVSRKYFLIGGDSEDLVQEGMIGLFKAIRTFDLNKNDNFCAFATMLIEREVISAIRRATSHSQQFLSDSVLLDNDDTLSDNISPESDLINEESTLELTQEIKNNLSSFERKVVAYYLKGYNYNDIANLLGKTSKSIDNALTRIKKKLNYLKERL
ncbi:MAG: sigma-70 family RNA polymerase sigma factor [Clostridia bacterium]|nr:sigma-70 family RNA polymerase sigma factor [Clostridia bacterium]